MRTLVMLLGIVSIACASTQYSASDCEDDVALVTMIAQEIIAEETSDMERARKRVLYAELVGRIAVRGCGFVPDDL